MDQEIREFTAVNAGERLDKIVAARLPDLSRTQVQALIADGAVLVDGEPSKPGVKMKGGETVRIVLTIEPPEEDVIEPEEIALNIIYEDDDIAVIDKPAGMVIHPGVGNPRGTLVNALLARYPELVDMQDDEDAEGRMGIVHRLDKETSGLVVVARHIDALHNLMAQFRERTVDKYYLALVENTPKTHVGLIDAPIGRDPRQRKRMSVLRSGKAAQTEFEVIDSQFRDNRALLRLKILTGRTHQIRVHLAYINCPIVGDRVYGYRKQRVKLKRNFLHAAELHFDHPRTGERMTFTSELPVGLANVMEKLR